MDYKHGLEKSKDFHIASFPSNKLKVIFLDAFESEYFSNFLYLNKVLIHF